MVVVSSHNNEHCVGASWWVCVSSSALSSPVLGFLLEQQTLQGGDSIACVYSGSPHDWSGWSQDGRTPGFVEQGCERMNHPQAEVLLFYSTRLSV